MLHAPVPCRRTDLHIGSSALMHAYAACHAVSPANPCAVTTLHAHSKPKVCAYLERTFIMRERNRPDLRKLKVPNVWAGVVESFAVTMMRYHTKQPALLQPFIRASDPAMTATQPWANMLWLGLAAPPEVFQLVSGLCACLHVGTEVCDTLLHAHNPASACSCMLHGFLRHTCLHALGSRSVLDLAAVLLLSQTACPCALLAACSCCMRATLGPRLTQLRASTPLEATSCMQCCSTGHW